jgi:glucan 1,3-beta-glucosidase
MDRLYTYARPTNTPSAPANDTVLGVAMFDANMYIPGFGGAGLTWWDNQNNFCRQIRNFKFDLRNGPNDGVAIHWQVAQATSMQNIEIFLKPGKNTDGTQNTANTQVGINMENGSGGWFSNVIIHGGNSAMSLGSQQFTVRDISIDGAWTGVKMIFGWTWLFARMNITNVQIGFDFLNGGSFGGTTHVTLIVDSVISAQYGVLSKYKAGRSNPPIAGSLTLDRVDMSNSQIAIADSTDTVNGNVILPGRQNIPLWVQGNVWTIAGQAQNQTFFNTTTCTVQNNTNYRRAAEEVTVQRLLAPIARPAGLTDSVGRWVGRPRPQYEDKTANDFLSAKAEGLVGDGLAGQSR